MGKRLRHKVLPLGQGGRASCFVILATDEMAFLVEVVGDVGVDRGKFLQGLHLPEPEHCPFSSSEGQVAVFSSVVGPAANLLLRCIAKLDHRRFVRS